MWLVCFSAFTGLSNEASGQSAGLFIGIGKFDFRTGLKPLEYAPDDAVALAYRFVVELGEIAPHRAILVLGGEPKANTRRKQLEKLKELGVLPRGGTRDGCLKALHEFERLVIDSPAQAVVTFSGHGYELSQDVFLMPTDGDWQLVRTRGMAFDRLLEPLRKSKAKTKLLVLDACREIPDRTKVDSASADLAIQKRVKSVQDLTTLVSCSAGEKSWQSATLEQSVFTHFILQGLRSDLSRNGMPAAVLKESREWMEKFGGKVPNAWAGVYEP